MSKKKLAVLMCCVCTMVGMTGCQFLPPKTSSDLIARSNNALEKGENFAMDYNLNITMKTTYQGVNIDIPIILDGTAKVEDKGIYWSGTYDIDCDYLGIDTVNVDMYMNQIDTSKERIYVCINDGDWTYTEYDFNQKDEQPVILSNYILINNDDFSDVKLGKNSNDDFVVKLPIQDLVKSSSFMFGLGEENEEIIKDLTGDFRITFDPKTFYPKQFLYKTEDIDTGTEGVSATLDIKCKFKDFGKTKITLDQKAIEKAEKSDAKDINDLLGGYTSSMEEDALNEDDQNNTVDTSNSSSKANLVSERTAIFEDSYNAEVAYVSLPDGCEWGPGCNTTCGYIFTNDQHMYCIQSASPEVVEIQYLQNEGDESLYKNFKSEYVEDITTDQGTFQAFKVSYVSPFNEDLKYNEYRAIGGYTDSKNNVSYVDVYCSMEESDLEQSDSLPKFEENIRQMFTLN